MGEAISPTLPGDSRDESPFKTAKEDLLQKIAQTDREIQLAESQIVKLKKQQEEMEKATKRQADGEKMDTDDGKENAGKDLAQIIYDENMKKAAESHQSLLRHGPIMEFNLPLFNQP